MVSTAISIWLAVVLLISVNLAPEGTESFSLQPEGSEEALQASVRPDTGRWQLTVPHPQRKQTLDFAVEGNRFTIFAPKPEQGTPEPMVMDLASIVGAQPDWKQDRRFAIDGSTIQVEQPEPGKLQFILNLKVRERVVEQKIGVTFQPAKK